MYWCPLIDCNSLQGLNPTNHATIQSIVHAIGGYPEVPAPCCVPDVLSSLTLLYFDDNRNVVLKNYPSMTAESCACRWILFPNPLSFHHLLTPSSLLLSMHLNISLFFFLKMFTNRKSSKPTKKIKQTKITKT